MPATRASFIVDGFSVFPFLLSLHKLNEPKAEKLVDLALETPVIRPLQDRSEFLELANLVGELRPTNVLEIGTFRGGTLFVFARLSSPNATLVSLDLPTSAFGSMARKGQELLFRQFPREQQRLVVLRRNSHLETTRANVAAALNGPLDFLFIDGDHSYDGVKADFEMYSPLVRPGGMIAFHDIADRHKSDYGVTQFWSEIKSRFRNREILHSPEPDPMGIGVLWM